jgi:uncharacterized membrane-anchored protein YitT (DUF2179 family)
MNTNFIAYNISRDIFFVVLGALLFGVSLDVFLLPGKIVLGGFTGIATLLNIMFNMHASAVILILNVPFAIVNVKYHGFRFLLKAFIGIFVTSASCELLLFLPGVTDPLLCAVAGGSLMGAACALLFTRGYTTGGTDLIAWLLRVKFDNISIGTLIFLSDAVIILAAASIIRSLDGLLLSILSVALCSQTLDMVLKITHNKEELRYIP